jgi:glycosyltransferase involved in cell wall biosynthesis
MIEILNLPKVSVVIPVYNAEDTILDALQSVVDQTYQGEIEILIVNDGSTDASELKIRAFYKNNNTCNLQLFTQANQGVSAARNVGLRKSKGEFIALLDADDEWNTDKIEKQIQVILQSQFPIDFLATRRNHIPIHWPYSSKDGLVKVSFWQLLIRNEITSPSVIFNKKIVDQGFFYDPLQRYAEDVLFYLSVSKIVSLYILDEGLVTAGKGKLTFGVSGLSAQLYPMHLGYLRILKLLYFQKEIGFILFFLLYFFYKLKYFLLIIRTMHHRFLGR